MTENLGIWNGTSKAAIVNNAGKMRQTQRSPEIGLQGKNNKN